MSSGHRSPLRGAVDRAGAVLFEYHGVPLPRHFGDPAAEYAAATSGLAVFDRSHRTRLLVRGRSPGLMLKGVLSGVMPELPGALEGGAWKGRFTYHAADNRPLPGSRSARLPSLVL